MEPIFLFWPLLIKYTELAYQAELQNDIDTDETCITDPQVYNAKFDKRGSDLDVPTFHQVLSGLDADNSMK